MASASGTKGKKLDSEKVYLINKYFHQHNLIITVIAKRLDIAKRTVSTYLLSKEEWLEQEPILKAQKDKPPKNFMTQKREFIIKENGTNYYLVNEDSPDNKEEMSIISQKGGTVMFEFSLAEAANHPELPEDVKGVALEMIEKKGKK